MKIPSWNGPGTKRPGEFKARCRKERWVPLNWLLEQPHEQQPDTTTTQWDRDLKVEVALVQCDFDATDAASYLAHMAEVHNKKPRGPRQLKRGTGHWRAPQLKDEGQPLKPSTKAIAARIETCEGCGLVAEVDETAASVLWWDQHLQMCVERERAAS
ncbi:hypothetical protein ABKW28_12940 [Nocardioides sp. 31GB23]|uniref:hypothetical protein n=1 Tax=Nocardioides sp. 31GB23 TaxID=3156065 RepID=UPI0032AFD1A2